MPKQWRSERKAFPMPTFYFDVYDGQKAIYDEFGAELSSLDEATDEAAALLPGFAREVMPDQQSHSFGAAVRDESGSIVYRAMLLFQGQKTANDDKAYVTAIADAHRQRAKNADLRAAARTFADRLAQNAEGLLRTFEELKAQVEASHKTAGPYRPAGIT